MRLPFAELPGLPRIKSNGFSEFGAVEESVYKLLQAHDSLSGHYGPPYVRRSRGFFYPVKEWLGKRTQLRRC